MKGKFITFEGVEGCGKSTQTKLLKDFLEKENIQIMATREPGGPIIAEEIRNLLLDPIYKEMLPETEMLLYMAARSQHTGEWIIPALEAGKFVICDRYYDSTIAYQGAARDLDRKMIDMIRAYATYGLVPDLTILIDMPAEVGLTRISGRAIDRLEQESLEFHKKVRAGYLKLAEENSDRFWVIDGQQEISAIQTEIRNKILELMR